MSKFDRGVFIFIGLGIWALAMTQVFDSKSLVQVIIILLVIKWILFLEDVQLTRKWDILLIYGKSLLTKEQLLIQIGAIVNIDLLQYTKMFKNG